MAEPDNGLDATCPVCDRRSGDHTLDEWAACLGGAGLEIPFSAHGGETPQAVQEELRRRFGIDDGRGVSDNIVVRAAVLDITVGAGIQGAVLPAVLFDFEASGTGVVAPVASVVYVADPGSMRKLGKLLRDTANGAANAAERSR